MLAIVLIGSARFSNSGSGDDVKQISLTDRRSEGYRSHAEAIQRLVEMHHAGDFRSIRGDIYCSERVESEIQKCI
jgi:hypothetical protein